MSTTFAGLPVRNTSTLITPDTKLCALVYAPPKFGKTTLGATLDQLTKKYFGKPSLFVACEAAEGGGTMTIQDYGVDFVQPRDYNEAKAVVAQLLSDTTYGGVIVDSSTEIVKQFVQPYALKFASKMRDPRREAGVPARDDYQTMGEEMRKLLNQIVRLSSHPDPKVRKHVVVTALLKEKYDDEGKIVIRVQPDLPGAMAEAATAMFQTVGTLRIRQKVTKDPKTGAAVRSTDRVLVTDADGVYVLGDRTKRFPKEGTPSFLDIWEQCWIPSFTATPATVNN